MSLPTAEKFLAKRLAAKQERRFPRCWGMSSDALALYGIGEAPRPLVPGTPKHSGPHGYSLHGTEVGHGHPHDPSDLMACEETYKMAPPYAQEVMLPVLVEFRAWVLDGINRYGVKVTDGYRGKVIGHPHVFIPGAWGDCLDPARPDKEAPQ